MLKFKHVIRSEILFTRRSGARDIAQLVESLTNMYDALGSNSSTIYTRHDSTCL